MSQLFVKDLLQNRSFQSLIDDHGIDVRPDNDLTKFSLNYNMIKASPSDPVSQQCRGLIVRPCNPMTKEDYLTRIVGDVEIVAWPLSRFYNAGDPNAASIAWDGYIFEKLDGTMCILYWDELKSNWCVATRSVPEADLPIMANSVYHEDMTFSMLFWRALEATTLAQFNLCCHDWIVALDKQNTYVFELTSKLNRVVVKYDEDRVTLLAARNTKTGQEIDIVNPSVPMNIGAPMVAHAKILNAPNSIDGMISYVNGFKPDQFEGAVIVDRAFNRLKVKNQAWVLSSKAKDLITVSKKNAVEAILKGQLDDIIAIIDSDIADELRVMETKISSYFKSIDRQFIELKQQAGNDRKFFAELVNSQVDWATPFFQMYTRDYSSIVDWVSDAMKNGRFTSNMIESIIRYAHI